MDDHSPDEYRKYLKRQGKKVNCPVWKTTKAWTIEAEDNGDRYYFSPRAGGVFRIEKYHFGKLSGKLYGKDWERFVRLSSWVYGKNRLGEIGYLTYEEIVRIEKQARLRIEQQLNRLLECFAKLPNQVSYGLCLSGKDEDISRDELEIVHAATECSTREELNWLVSAAERKEWLEENMEQYYGGERRCKRLTPAGMERLEELQTNAMNSEQAFVAMWFDESVADAYEEGIWPAIEESGYKPLRIDRKEHIRKIDDQIISEIKRSRFVVCDFTCELIECDGEKKAFPRGGVYYEAGFAQGLGIPVIWTCREDHLEHVHFGTRQFNHITWNTPEELRKKLRNRVDAVMGDGPLKARS